MDIPVDLLIGFVIRIKYRSNVHELRQQKYFGDGDSSFKRQSVSGPFPANFMYLLEAFLVVGIKSLHSIVNLEPKQGELVFPTES